MTTIPADWAQTPLRFTGVTGFAHVMRHEGDDETGYVVWCRCGWSSRSRSYETGAVESAKLHRLGLDGTGDGAAASR